MVGVRRVSFCPRLAYRRAQPGAGTRVPLLRQPLATARGLHQRSRASGGRPCPPLQLKRVRAPPNRLPQQHQTTVLQTLNDCDVQGAGHGRDEVHHSAQVLRGRVLQGPLPAQLQSRNEPFADTEHGAPAKQEDAKGVLCAIEAGSPPDLKGESRRRTETDYRHVGKHESNRMCVFLVHAKEKDITDCTGRFKHLLCRYSSVAVILFNSYNCNVISYLCHY